jgi:DNA-binding NarL/FixJ family response regulator
MLALVLAHPGLICDGLVALLGSTPEVRKIVHIKEPIDALDFAQKINPDITLIHTSSLSQELAFFIIQLKEMCDYPVLIIVASEEDRKTAIAHGADVAVMEGLPSVTLGTHISILLQQNSDTKTVEFTE